MASSPAHHEQAAAAKPLLEIEALYNAIQSVLPPRPRVSPAPPPLTLPLNHLHLCVPASLQPNESSPICPKGRPKVYCDPCGKYYPFNNLAVHLKSRTHQRKAREYAVARAGGDQDQLTEKLFNEVRALRDWAQQAIGQVRQQNTAVAHARDLNSRVDNLAPLGSAADVLAHFEAHPFGIDIADHAANLAHWVVGFVRRDGPSRSLSLSLSPSSLFRTNPSYLPTFSVQNVGR